MAAAGPGGGQSGAGAFADQVAFELGQGGKDVEDELAAGGGGVDCLLEAAEPDPIPRSASTRSTSLKKSSINVSASLNA